MRYVKGRTRTMEFSIVMPGSAPATMPMVRPTTIIRKLSGWTALTKPFPRLRRISPMCGGLEDPETAVERQRHRLEDAVALGQRQVHELDEEVQQPDGSRDRPQPDGGWRARPSQHHERGDESRGDQREAEPRGQRDVEHDHRDGNGERAPADAGQPDGAVARRDPTKVLDDLGRAGQAQADQDEPRPEPGAERLAAGDVVEAAGAGEERGGDDHAGERRDDPGESRHPTCGARTL